MKEIFVLLDRTECDIRHPYSYFNLIRLCM